MSRRKCDGSSPAREGSTDRVLVDLQVHSEAEGEEQLVLLKERPAHVHVEGVGEVVPENLQPGGRQREVIPKSHTSKKVPEGNLPEQVRCMLPSSDTP